MAHALAQELGVALVMAEQLRTGYCDIIMSGVVVTPQRAQIMTFAQPYLDQTVTFVVRDHRRDEFSIRTRIAASQDIGLCNRHHPAFVTDFRVYPDTKWDTDDALFWDKEWHDVVNAAFTERINTYNQRIAHCRTIEAAQARQCCRIQIMTKPPVVTVPR
jgi:ABC-type amino acid transport substrate-binding protein